MTATPEQIAAKWHRLEAIGATIQNGETRAQYRAKWRADFEAIFPPADPDEPILPSGGVIPPANEVEKERLKTISLSWWKSESQRLKQEMEAAQIKAVGHSLGRRIAAGFLDRASVESVLPPEIVTMPAWQKAYDSGLKRPFTGEGQLLLMRCSTLPLTEYGMAERWRARHAQNFRYTTGTGWLHWDGGRWAITDQEQNSLPAPLIASIFETVRAVQEEARIVRQTGTPPKSIAEGTIAAHEASGKPISEYGLNWGGVKAAEIEDFGRQMETSGGITAVGRIVKQWVTCKIGDFDTERMAVNVQNGTLRFERMDDGRWISRLDPHNRDDLNTKIAAVAWQGDAASPIWDEFIRWAQPDDDRRRYVRQWMGYCLSGDTGAQELQFWHGRGGNGKSVAVNACSDAAGDYAATIKIESLLAQSGNTSGDAASPAFARLSGIRMLRTSEPGENAKVDEGLIKLITGQEPFPTRHLHKGFFDLLPYFKLIISGNSPLSIKGVDEGIWRRLVQVPWEASKPKEEQDQHLNDKLALELPGIFAWMVEGLLDWLENGFVKPGSVIAATEAWRDDSDPLGRFLRECTEPDPASSVQSSQLHKLYDSWATFAGEFVMSNKKLTQRLKTKGFKVESSNGSRVRSIRMTRSERDFVDEHGKALKGDTAASASAPDAAPPPDHDGWDVPL